MVTVERFIPNPEHGRPKIVSFKGPRGELAVHCERESGALFLFAIGPSRGDRGRIVFPTSQAAQLRAWLETGARGAAPSTGGKGVLWLDRRGDGEQRTLVVAKSLSASGSGTRWQMVLDDAARDEFLLCLREWCATVKATAG